MCRVLKLWSLITDLDRESPLEKYYAGRTARPSHSESSEVRKSILGDSEAGLREESPEDWITSLTSREKTYYKRVQVNLEIQMEVSSSVRAITRSLETSIPSDRTEEHLQGAVRRIECGPTWKASKYRKLKSRVNDSLGMSQLVTLVFSIK